MRRKFNGRKEEADDGLDVKEEHQLDALQPVSLVANSNTTSSSSSSRFDSSHTYVHARGYVHACASGARSSDAPGFVVEGEDERLDEVVLVA